MATHEHNAEWLFDHSPYSEFVGPEDHDRAVNLLDSALDQLEPGTKLEDLDEFWEYLDLMGLEYEEFDWDGFREWYDS